MRNASSALKKSNLVPNGFNQLLDKLNDIPTLPIVATKVNEMINNPNSSAGDIAEILKKDQVLTAKILKLVNSPYYNIPGGVTDVKRALAFLGFNTLAQLVLGMSVFSLFPQDENEDFPLVKFWRHALGAAVCSNVIAKQLKYQKPEECFTCGLLHDVGKIVMYTIAKDMLFNIVRLAREKNISFVHAESELNVPTHSFLGEHIAKKWGLPQVIRTAIHFHHQDVREVSTILEVEKIPVQIVTLANVIVKELEIGHSGNYSTNGLEPWMLEALNLKIADLDGLKIKTREEMSKVGNFFTL